MINVCRTRIIKSMITNSVSPVDLTKKKLFHRILSLSPHDKFQNVCDCFVFVFTCMLAYLMMKSKLFVFSLYLCELPGVISRTQGSLVAM